MTDQPLQPAQFRGAVVASKVTRVSDMPTRECPRCGATAQVATGQRGSEYLADGLFRPHRCKTPNVGSWIS